MQITIGKGGNQPYVVLNQKLVARRLSRLKVVNLKAIFALQHNPFNVVGFYHRMTIFPHSNEYSRRIALYRRNMFFFGSIYSVGLQFRHRLAATNHGNAGVFKVNHDITTYGATVKDKVFHRNLLF